ncbi:MAG: DUF1802 family protein [Candidatus Binatia bacterium]
MLARNSLALKEWAVVVESLARGKQILLLRKGGLYERQGRFSTEPTEFFFFPTYVHQMEQGVVPEAAPELRTVLQNRPASDQLSITRYATVTNVHWLDSREQVQELTGLHCWTSETVEKRFTYKHPGLYLFVLRVYQLSRVYTLPALKRYLGCRSWVELADSLGTESATPVLDDEAFAARAREVNVRLSL